MSVSTTDAKDELCRVTADTPALRGAELSALVRFADGLHLGAGGLVVEVELDHHRTATRFARTLRADYGHQPALRSLTDRSARPGARPPRYVLVLTDRAAEDVARRTGLLDRRGRPVTGLPASLVGGSTSVAESLWRGAFLARGALVADGRTSALTVTCPGLEAGLALVGAARRLGVTARHRDVRGRVQVSIRDANTVAHLLERIGAPDTAHAWTEHHRHRRRFNAESPRLLLRANLRRSERAATETATRVRWALTVLGADVPEHLEAAGRLRLEHPTVSLEDLGRRSVPPLSKDTVAGRLRRLITTAERTTRHTGNKA